MPENKTLRRILVVDDDRFIRAVLEKALSVGGGYVVKAVDNGKDAIDAAREFSPDLILLDLVMPGMDGPETYKEMRSVDALAATPIAFLTAATDESRLQQLRTLGAIFILAKPFNPSTLSQDLEKLWQEFRISRANDDDLLTAELDTLRAEYAASLPNEVKQIRDKISNAFKPSADRSVIALSHRAVHSLNGSGASFGFDDVSSAAARLEEQISNIEEIPTSANTQTESHILRLMDELESAAIAASNAAVDGTPLHTARTVSISAEPQKASRSGNPQRPRILIIDDVAAVRRRYSIVLARAGFDVDDAESGNHAIKMVSAKTYDIILMDLLMPGMDGFETQQRLRQHRSSENVPIVFMTATSNVDLVRIKEALAQGVSGFIPKSLPPDKLVCEIRAALQKKPATSVSEI